ncbi:hypothetical protein TSUD_40320 [Trifolium subterraneum]|uniref:Uncharacterized protein n=1 Tax=Trifolium subterraneum TaxID=3900 RepID=A0A2Z6LVA9_TRISU|nr:hypothetical protein TSUD_40320 [Trifolium subterraneum]
MNTATKKKGPAKKTATKTKQNDTMKVPARKTATKTEHNESGPAMNTKKKGATKMKKKKANRNNEEEDEEEETLSVCWVPFVGMLCLYVWG